jgi:hypothetical protein
MTSAALIALIAGSIWAVAFYFAVRHREPFTIVAVLLAWGVNYFLGTGNFVLGNGLRLGNTVLIVLLLIDRLSKSPEHITRVMATQLSDTRRDLHDQESDRASWEARAVAYKRLLDKHGIKP